MPARTPDKLTDQPRAWRCLACHLRLWIVLVALLTLDLVSKHLAFTHLGQPGSENTVAMEIIPGALEFHTQSNEGAAFGMFRGQRVLFVAVGVLALGVFLVLFARSLARQWFMHAGIALVLAGALGNLFDRVVFGEVRDFIHITLQWSGREVYPAVFNVADIALVVGVVMIMISSLRGGRSGGRAKSEAQ